MTAWFVFILAALSCFRLTRLITDDKIMDWLRRDVSKAGKKAREGIRCPFCVSFWMAGLVTLGLILSGTEIGQMTWLWWMSIWGGSVLLNQFFLKLSA